jgi:hypothetical protein
MALPTIEQDNHGKFEVFQRYAPFVGLLLVELHRGDGS